MKRIVIGFMVFMFFAVAASGEITVVPNPVVLEKELNPDTYIVGVGDQFLIEKVQEQAIFTIPVSPMGEISIPGVSRIHVAGKSLSNALQEIRAEAGSYTIVTLNNVKNIRIPVTGAVTNPGIYSVSAAYRISDLLKQVQLTKLGKDYEVQIRSSKGTKIVNIYNFFIKGELEENPYLHAGENIFIPFASIETECVNVFGPVRIKTFVEISTEETSLNKQVDDVISGIVPLIEGETLGDFIKRKIQMRRDFDSDKILIVRDGKNIFISNMEMDSFVLEAKDKIEFASISYVYVSGYVFNPGTYSFIPGHTILDYVAMAGGISEKGSTKSTVLLRGNKKIKDIENVEIRRGDIILVKRSLEDMWIGETSVLTFVSLIATIATTIITAMIASGN